MEEFFSIFCESTLFRGIDEEGIRGMLRCLGLTVRRYPRGGVLLQAGETSHAIGMVLAGRVHLVKEDFWGNHAILTDVRPGETFGEAAALTGDSPLYFGAEAAEPTAAVFLPVTCLMRTCSENWGCRGKVIENLLAIVAARNLAYEKKCGHLSHRTTREKLLSFLSEQSAEHKSDAFTIPYNRQQLSDYLSVDRSAMSAELSRMQADGLLRYERSYFHLLRAKTSPNDSL